MKQIKEVYVKDRNFPDDIYLSANEIKYDDQLNNKILQIVLRYRCNYTKQFQKIENKEIYDYILVCTKHLPLDKFRLAIRIFWVLNKWQDFPKCICGKRLILDNENKGFRLKFKDGKLVYMWPKGCCPSHAQKTENARQNYINTCIKKYGTINAFQADVIKNKIKETLLDKYNVTSPAKFKQFLDKMQNTCIKRYGVKNPYQSEQIKAKIKQTCLKHFNAEHPMQNRDILVKGLKRYSYDDKTFDSAPELAYYIWLKDNNIEFEYQPKIRLEYIVNGQIHYYFPDFKVEQQLVEIKGPQFFKADGSICNPYNTDDTGIIEKFKCMYNNNVKILKECDYTIYLAYINDKYGKDFLKKFKNKV